MAKEKRIINGKRAVFALFAVVALGLSVYFSMSSFTGYAVSDEVDAGRNIFALVLFFVGIGFSYLGLRRK